MLLVALHAFAAPPLLLPDPRGRGNPDRAFDVEKLRLDLVLDPPRGSVAGTATFTVRRLGPGPLVLDEVALGIDGVTDGAATLPWHVAQDQLTIEVGGATQVVIDYHATPQTGLHFRGGAAPDTYPEVWSQGEGHDNRHWLPSWDHLADRFAYEGHITAPPGWTVVTNSGPDLVNYLIMLAAAPYETYTSGDDAIYVPPGTSSVDAHAALDPVASMRAHFAARTGVPYAWGPYRQVFVQRFLYGGMENTSATIEMEELVHEGRAAATRKDRVWTVVSHELAHQWFGDLLTCRTWRETWLNEGFATFYAADWIAAQSGPATWAWKVRRWFESSRGPGELAGRFYRPDLPDSSNAYDKGASVLQMLRVMLGEDRFWAGMRAYVGGHAHSMVETSDLRRAFEDATGQDLGWFFQQWVELPYVPVVAVDWTWRDGAVHVHAKQAVDDATPAYTLPLAVEVGGPSGPVRATVWAEAADADVVVPLAAAPTYVAVDPDGGVLAKFDWTQDPTMWAAQLAHASTPYARLVAIEALGDTTLAEPLAAVLLDEHEAPELRVGAAQALGRQRATATLLRAAATRDDVVRAAVLDALGTAVDTSPVPVFQAALTAENPDLRAAALRAWGKVDGPGALPAARAALRARGHEEDLWLGAGVDIVAAQGKASDLPALLAVRLTGRATEVALDGATRLAVRLGDPHGKAEVARAAEVLLADPDLRWERAALGSLAKVGDAHSVAVIEAWRRTRTVPDLVTSAGDTLAAIQAQAPASAPPNQLQADVEALRRRIDTLEEKLAADADRH